MKYLILIFSLIISEFESVSLRHYQIECVSLESSGYITINIWNPKKGAKYKLEQARKEGIYSILYAGVSGDKRCATQPPILKKQGDLDNFNKIEKSFFSKKGKWSSFTRSSSKINATTERIGDKNWKVYQITISKDELRKFLEEQQIIKPLLNGF
jgi:HJR/Mrr/RecB family endonuclease